MTRQQGGEVIGRRDGNEMGRRGVDCDVKIRSSEARWKRERNREK